MRSNDALHDGKSESGSIVLCRVEGIQGLQTVLGKSRPAVHDFKHGFPVIAHLSLYDDPPLPAYRLQRIDQHIIYCAV